MEHKSTLTVPELRKHLMVILEGSADRILIKVEDETFPVHKGLLSIYSPVFAAMFQHDTLENMQKCVNIQDSSKEIIGELIKFIYTGKTSELCPSLASELYVLADKYSIAHLQTLCSNFLASSLAEENVVGVLVLANRLGDKNLLEKIVNMQACESVIMEEVKAIPEQRQYEEKSRK